MMRRKPVNEDVAARRRTEDESPRLLAVVPRLVSLRLEIEEGREGHVEVSHIRRIAVQHAPAVFMIPCGDPRCKSGSYDLTQTILPALQRGETVIKATDTCMGDVGTARCGRVLRCTAVAEYQSSDESAKSHD